MAPSSTSIFIAFSSGAHDVPTARPAAALMATTIGAADPFSCW